jgi:Uma2 family endonuclease
VKAVAIGKRGEVAQRAEARKEVGRKVPTSSRLDVSVQPLDAVISALRRRLAPDLGYTWRMSTARRLHHTYDQYLEVERLSSVRHEFLDGEIYAMAGGTPEHGILAARLTALLSAGVPAGCHVASSDVKIFIESTGLATYPDISVVCGPLVRAARDPLAIINPVLLVEVTSPSTEDYDRGDKLSQYRQISSLETVLLVSHGSRRITVVQRDAGAWATSDVRSGERVTLAAPAITFDVDAVYTALDGI